MTNVDLASIKGPITAEQLWSLPLSNQRCELIEGELRMMSPAGGRHGRIGVNVTVLLSAHVRADDLGVVYGADTGFIIGRDPDTVRSPDVAFVSHDRARQIVDEATFLPFAPNLAVEVVSPGDSLAEADLKANLWLTTGAELVLLLFPETRKVHALRREQDVVVLTESEVLDASDVVPGWRADVGEFFR